jgi:uncharacterized protein YukE
VSKLEALALKAKQLSSEIERLSKSANLDNMNKLKSDAEKIKQEIDDIVNNITKSTKLVDLKNSVDEANKLKIEFDKIDIDPTKLEKKLKEAEELEKKFTKLNINPDKLEEQYNKAKKFFDDFNILKINPSNLENEYNKAKKFVDDFKLLSIDPKELAKNLKAAEKILADFKKINIDPTGLNSKLENAKKIKKAFDEIKIDPTDLNNKLTIAKKIVEDYNNLKIDEMAEKANKVLETANEAETKYNNIKEELDKLAIGFDSFAKWKESNDKLLEKINKFFGDGESEPEAITKLREAIRIKNEAIDKNLKNINKVLTDPDTGLEKRFSDASLLLSSLDKYINGTDPLTDPGIKGKIKEIDTNVEYLESARKIIYNDVYAKEVGLRDQLIKAKRELTSSAKSSADIVEMMRILIVGLYKNNMLDKWFVTDKNKKQQELQQEFSKAVKLLIEAGVTIDQGKDKLDFN